MTDRPPARARRGYTVAAAVALVVTVVFATVGDGVDVPDAAGLRAVAVDHGHTLVWILLTLAFAIAALRAKWNPASQVIAVAAGVVYALFLIAVFVGR